MSSIVYQCASCGAAGVKLWRDYNMFLDHIKLRCATCCIKPPESPFVFEDGDAFGWMVPAVPTEEMDTFWGYTSVPSDRVQWWYSLPTYLDAELEVMCLRNLSQRWLARYHFAADSLMQAQHALREVRS